MFKKTENGVLGNLFTNDENWARVTFYREKLQLLALR